MVVVNIPVTFTDSSTGNISTSWDFGDGTPLVTGSSVSHTFSVAGTFRVKDTIISTTGETISCFQDIIVTSPTTGALDISSAPLGAEIFIDNTDQGKVTRSIITNIPVGSHSLKLTLVGYQDYTTTFTITGGVTTTLNPTLGTSIINVIINPINGGTVTENLQNGILTLTAYPNAGFRFDHFNDTWPGGNEDSTDNPLVDATSPEDVYTVFFVPIMTCSFTYSQ